MFTSQTEQQLNLRLDHPSHLDLARRSLSAGVLAGCVSGYAISSKIGIEPSIYVGVTVAVLTAVTLHYWMLFRAKKRVAKRMEETRQIRETERARQMAEAKATGAFDRFGTNVDNDAASLQGAVE